MSTGASYEKQNRKDQEPTITEKSSGLDYLENSIVPADQGIGERKQATKNDKGSAG